jgi:hypothetical protein
LQERLSFPSYCGLLSTGASGSGGQYHKFLNDSTGAVRARSFPFRRASARRWRAPSWHRPIVASERPAFPRSPSTPLVPARGLSLHRARTRTRWRGDLKTGSWRKPYRKRVRWRASEKSRISRWGYRKILGLICLTPLAR